jgi:hypothetical protein
VERKPKRMKEDEKVDGESQAKGEILVKNGIK